MSYFNRFVATPSGRTFQDLSITKVPTYTRIIPNIHANIHSPYTSKYKISHQGVIIKTENSESSSIDDNSVLPLIVESGVIIQSRPSSYYQMASYLYDEASDEPVPQLPSLRSTDPDPDPEFGISQEWLLNQRQGDEYDQIPERKDDYSEAEDPAIFYLWTNRTPIYNYNQLPNLKPTPITGLDDEFKRMQEYALNQEQETEDKLPQQYSIPPQQYSMPPQQYSIPPQQYSMPPQQYSIPPKQYSIPPQRYSIPT